MQVSLSDVANKAGVSAATVSRVLNGKELARIPETTQRRVKAAAASLNYAPNHFARGLQARRTMNIGVIVNGLRNPFFADLLDTLEEMIVAAGYDVLPATGDRAASDALRGWPVDGVLMWAVGHQRIEATLLHPSAGIPVVYLGHKRSDNSHFVAHDAEQGTLLALDRFWSAGHRRIALASPPDREMPSVELRRATYYKFCAAHGIAPILLDVPLAAGMDERSQSGYRQSGYATGLQLSRAQADTRPTAVFCYNDLIALGLLNGALAGGLQVPGDVAVIGFDGIDEGLYQVKPLTTVEIPSRQICAVGLELLLRLIAHDVPEEARQILLPMSIRDAATV